MKTKWTLIGFCLFTVMVTTAAFIIIQQKAPPALAGGRQDFQVNGVVRNLESDGKTVVIEHEDIPDFMPSMTMPFSVKDPGLLRGLQSGDPVHFELVVTKDDSWIARIEKRTGPAGETAGGEVGTNSAPAAAAEPREIEPGQTVPDFALIDENGKPIHLRDYRGQAVLLTFVYTRCPLPNYCPLMSKNFELLQERLGKALAGRFHLITISFDPGYDTPEVLKRYAAAFTQDESTWTFATGTTAQVDQAASQFGLVYLPEAGSFTHDLRTALISPDGRLIHVWRSNVWTPYEVQRWVAEALQPRQQWSPLVSAGTMSTSEYQSHETHE
jgi:protein SCO1